jgi:hypothetical protein
MSTTPNTDRGLIVPKRNSAEPPRPLAFDLDPSRPVTREAVLAGLKRLQARFQAGVEAVTQRRGFQGPLDVRYINGDTWELTAPLVYVSSIAGRIEVPAGSHTDFASIPRGLWNVEPKSAYAPAAVIHDYAYRTGCLPRDVADRVFREALEVLGCGKVKRNLMFAAVRAFGGRAYGR